VNEMTLHNGRRPASGSVRCAASIDLRTAATEFFSDGLYAISRNSPVRVFFPGNGKFFWDPGKSSPVNIPTDYRDLPPPCHLHWPPKHVYLLFN